MSQIENYRIPYEVPLYRERGSLEWPVLRDAFKTNVLLGQIYFTREYILGADDPRTVRSRLQLEQSEAELRQSKKYPFLVEQGTHLKSDKLDSVVDDNFQFVDPLLSEDYNIASRRASNAATNYQNRNKAAWFKFSSPDRQVRKDSFEELCVPDKTLIHSLIEVFTQRADYMRKKVGSLRSYFLKKDGVDWEPLLEHSRIANLVSKFSQSYSQQRASHLGIGEYLPQDMYASNSDQVDEEKATNSDIFKLNPRLRLTNFLLSIGLDDVANKLLSVSSHNTGGYLLHIGRNWEPRPLVFMSDSSGRKAGSIEYDFMHAHEAGHASADYVGSRASAPLFGTNGAISEFPSMLFESIFREPDTLRTLGYGESSIEGTMNGFPSLIETLGYTEFEYRLLQHAENGTLSDDIIGKEFAQNVSKYYGNVHKPGDKNHLWQFLMSQQMLHDPWLHMRNYLVGETLARITVQKMRHEMGSDWVGSNVFKKRFSSLFRELFTNGPFVNLADIEGVLGIKMKDQILNILEAQVQCMDK